MPGDSRFRNHASLWTGLKNTSVMWDLSPGLSGNPALMKKNRQAIAPRQGDFELTMRMYAVTTALSTKPNHGNTDRGDCKIEVSDKGVNGPLHSQSQATVTTSPRQYIDVTVSAAPETMDKRPEVFSSRQDVICSFQSQYVPAVSIWRGICDRIPSQVEAFLQYRGRHSRWTASWSGLCWVPSS